MSWQAYQVTLRMVSPLHIGAGRVSYLQRARPYVTGRVIRGALVSRMARLCNERGETDGDPYRRVSKTFAQFMTFTYFYPALENDGGWKLEFPWEDETGFRRRFMSSYVSAALRYPQQTAAEGLLYETEFLSPNTLDSGEPVYLMGYIFVEEERLKEGKYPWKDALCRLQLGGERGYGWGEVRLVEDGLKQIRTDTRLFDEVRFGFEKNRPFVYLEARQHILAHVPAKCSALRGPVEPVIGREWRADNNKKGNGERIHIGQHLAFDDIYYTPGSLTVRPEKFIIGEAGYWLESEEDCDNDSSVIAIGNEAIVCS